MMRLWTFCPPKKVSGFLMSNIVLIFSNLQPQDKGTHPLNARKKMKAQSTIEEFQKSQAVRVWDMIFVGPILIFAGVTPSNLPSGLRFTITTIGIATIVYNANNYFKNESQYAQYQQDTLNANTE